MLVPQQIVSVFNATEMVSGKFYVMYMLQVRHTHKIFRGGGESRNVSLLHSGSKDAWVRQGLHVVSSSWVTLPGTLSGTALLGSSVLGKQGPNQALHIQHFP